MRKSSWGAITAVLGMLLVAAALVLRFIVVPGMLQLPDDVDVTRTYDGTLQTMLNPAALASGDLANIFITDVPVSISRHVTVEATDGGDALVVEQGEAVLPDGTPVAAQTDVYAVDRETMVHADAFADDDRVQPVREGLVIGWPIGTEQRDYQGWSDDLQAAVPITFEGEEERAGLDTYVFSTDIPPTPILDPATLAQLPAALPASTLQALALQSGGELPLPPDELIAIVGELPDPVPLTYLYSGATTYWVEPASGVVVDTERTETRSAALTVPSLPEPLALTAVFDWRYAQTEASVADAAADAEAAADRITLFGTTLPIVIGALGIVLLVTGLGLRRSAARVRTEVPDEPADRDQPRAGTVQDRPPVATG